MTNQELVRLCLAGSREGERLLYDKFVARMARLCLRYLKNKDDAQDVLMEGFLKAFNNLKRFEYTDENSLEVWIRKIMINECLMWLRKMKKVSLTEFDLELTPQEIPASDLSAEEIQYLIMQLPEGYRTVFNLHAIDGYSHEEIGTLLGITESASRSQLTHARQKLKELLTKHGWK